MNPWQQNGQTDGLFNQQTPTHLNQTMFSNLNSAGQFDLNGASAFQQQQQQQQALANGNTQTPNTAFSNQQTFQPGSVVPQKRPHDGGMSGSPQPPPQQQNQTSRSQTPNFGAFTNQQTAAQQFQQGATPTPYGHLQQPGSTQATPSPTMQNQQFRQPARMANASPSPFPQGQANFANQQNMTQQNSMAQGQMNMGQQFNMGNNMGVGNNAQAGGMNAALVAQQRQYQMRLMQQQMAMQQRQNGGAMQNRTGGNAAFNANQMTSTMQNGQAPTQQQQHQLKRQQFLSQCGAYVAKTGRPFNPNPSISGKPLDLYNLFTCVISGGGSGAIERQGQWQNVATKLGFSQAQYPGAAEEVKNVFISSVALYEKAWMTAKVSQKQEQARLHAQQMAGGFGTPPQSSPTKMMPPAVQANQQQAFNAQFPQAQQPQATPQPSAQATPVAAHASLPQNGATTPQAMQGLHRRNSSMRKQETPQAVPAPSPMSQVKPSPVVKAIVKPLRRNEPEMQSPTYRPVIFASDTDGGYKIPALFELGSQIAACMPHQPRFTEMGTIDIRAIALSLASGIHGEVRYALDMLAALSSEFSPFELEKCEDLIDVIVDCAEDQTDILADKAEEVSDSIDLPSYEDVVRCARTEAETLQDIPALGTQAYDLDRAADKIIAITTVLRNLSFTEHNHRLLTSTSVIKWLSHTLRLAGTRNMFLRTYLNLQDFYKDVIIFLSNITQSLELPNRDDALHILHFLLVFTPQPVPLHTASNGKLTFVSFVPTVHRYLPPAVDCLAKLLARQDPNRVFYRSIFHSHNTSNSNTSEEDPVDLLTRAFALAISVLPDRNRLSSNQKVQLYTVVARQAYLTQGMLAADILTTLLPSGESDVARAWIESDDGWASSLLGLASLLSVEPDTPMIGPKGQPMDWPVESFKQIAHRALSMMKRLAEKAGKGSAKRLLNSLAKTNEEMTGDGKAEDGIENVAANRKWEGIPQQHSIIGAMLLGTVDRAALSLLCGLHDLATQS
ncbi:hypothetical protein AMS68_006839 [Peltaster fructicola]|uniref:ARID domain-containing protein n=1 Tax=Peltaster fructicola TaxID=286661 RepID=A0A6H0Y2S6_9PEZI|nr:hypothetical protein AMS68_006839 [Peltaster fructicola]